MSNFPLQKTAQQLATQGRYGDSMLVHMNPIEVNALAQLSPTGQLTTNPATGQPEAFLPLLGSLLAPSLLGAAGIGASLSPLVAGAIGTGIGTIAEGGSLKEGLTAGLMGGLTGGLLGKMMPAAGADITSAAGDITQAAVPDVSTIGKLAEATAPSQHAITQLGAAPQGFLGRMGSSLGLTQGATPDMLSGAAPAGLTQGQALMGNLPQAASGMVGEMYVPYDMDMPEEENPYPYEGPYMPSEQRTMMGGFDPMASAFTGEQDMIGGNVFPDAPNFAGGGMIENLSGLGMIKNMMDGGGAMGILPMLYDQYKNRDDEEEKVESFRWGGQVNPPMGSDPKPMIPERPRPMPQESRVRRGPGFAYGGLLKMANGGSPAQRQIQESAETLERRKQDEMIARQLQGAMSAPMVDPRSQESWQGMPIEGGTSFVAPGDRNKTWQGMPIPRTLSEVMTPQPYQAPSISEIQGIQSGALDRLFTPSDPDNAIDRGSATFNRKYNPIVRGIEAIAPYPTKAGLEIYEAIDEFRKRNKD